MKLLKSGLFYIVILAIILSLCTEGAEGRRKILRGRKTINRTYYRPLGIPAWSIILLTAIGEIILGGIMYIVLRKVIIDAPLTGTYTVASTEEA